MAEAEETSSAHEMRAKFFRQRVEECAALVKTMTDQLSRRDLERTAAHDYAWPTARICLNILSVGNASGSASAARRCCGRPLRCIAKRFRREWVTALGRSRSAQTPACADMG